MNAPATVQHTLDELAFTAAEIDDSATATRGLATTVLLLEQAAGVSLGPVDGEPLVVLQRRFGRAHHRLAPESISAEEATQLLAALRTAAAPDADVRPVAVRPCTDAALAGVLSHG